MPYGTAFVGRFSALPLFVRPQGRPGGEDLVFLCAMADREENSYPTDLWLLEKGEPPRRLTGDGKTGAFLWDGPHTLLFISRRDPQAQKLQEAGEEATAFYRLDTTGGEAVKAFQVPLAASPLEKVGGRPVPALRAVGLGLLQSLPFKGQAEGGTAPGQAGGAGLPGPGRAALLLQRQGLCEQKAHRPVPLRGSHRRPHPGDAGGL